MGFHDFFRVGAHAIFTNENNQILQLKATYGEKRWGLPGGAIDPGETIHETLLRECKEELGVNIEILYLSGIYYHKIYQSQSCVFRCQMSADALIKLSEEHSEFKYFSLEELNPVQLHRVKDCLEFDGKVKSFVF